MLAPKLNDKMSMASVRLWLGPGTPSMIRYAFTAIGLLFSQLEFELRQFRVDEVTCWPAPAVPPPGAKTPSVRRAGSAGAGMPRRDRRRAFRALRRHRFALRAAAPGPSFQPRPGRRE